MAPTGVAHCQLPNRLEEFAVGLLSETRVVSFAATVEEVGRVDGSLVMAIGSP